MGVTTFGARASGLASSRWSSGFLALAEPVHVCYEAGPTGYRLYRAATAAGQLTPVAIDGSWFRDRARHSQASPQSLTTQIALEERGMTSAIEAVLANSRLQPSVPCQKTRLSDSTNRSL